MGDHGAVKTALTVIGTAATYLWGGWDAVLKALVALSIMDYVSGFASAWKRGEINSNVGWWGLAKKVGMFVLISACHVVDQTGITGEPILRTLVAWGFIVNELVSLAENLGEIGVPIPERVRTAIATLKNVKVKH